jgi:hypothetical protein
MMAPVRRRLTYANVMSTLALFVALGGVSYAVVKLPANSVGTKQLKAHAVTKGKLAKPLVTSLRVHCRAHTRQVFRVCFETALRPSANFYTATETCEERGGRLPTLGEIEAAEDVPGLLPSPAVSEMTGDGTYDSTDGAEYLTAPAVFRGFTPLPTHTADVYRCIYAPSN